MIVHDAWKWLASVVCASLLHCSDGTPAKVAAVDADASGPTCHAVQTKPDGSCCPAGQFFSSKTNTCERVGPPECAEVVFTAPEKCVPRWCWTWQDQGGKPCTAWTDGCDTAGRACTDAEILAGKGCPAGTFPESDKLGDCAPAGHFPGSGVPRDWDGDLKTLPPVPPLEDSIPPGVPPLTPLPAVDDTFFCRDGPNAEAHFCTEAEMQVCHRGPEGEMPDLEKCVYVGVPWPSVCPPGFIVDEKVKVSPGLLPPCSPDPADCGDDEYGDAELQDGMGIVFVNSQKGNDAAKGTRKAPLKTIGKALKLASSGGTVAVAGGIYNESLAVTKPVAIRGRCAAMVSVEGKAGAPVLLVNGKAQDGEVVVSGVRFGGKGSGVQVVGGPKVQLERVMVAGVSEIGILVIGSGAVLDGESVVVVGTLPRLSDKAFGVGVQVTDGAQVTLQDSRLSANRELGLGVGGAGTLLSAHRLLVDGTLSQQSDKELGRGLHAENGAQVTLQDARLSGNRELGLGVVGAGTTLEATRLLVDGTLSRESDKQFGRGMSVESGGHVTLQDGRLSANRESCIHVSGAGTTLGAIRLLIDGTLPQQSNNKAGRGMFVGDGAQVTLQDARLSANRELGLFGGAGATLGAIRLLVDGTLPQESDKRGGWGMGLLDGCHVTLQDARLSANRDVGLFVSDDGTVLGATRLLVDGTLPQASDERGGLGVNVQNGAQVTLNDARLSTNLVLGLSVSDAGTTLGATRLLVDGTLPQKSDKQFGRGVNVQNRSLVTLQDTRLSANRGLGLYVSDAKTTLGAARLLVDGTLPQQSDKRFGRGVNVQNGANLQILAARLLGNQDAGLFALAGSMDVIGVIIEATAPQDFDQTGGAGIWLSLGSNGSLVASALRSNHAIALAADESTLHAHGVVVVSTNWGDYLEIDTSDNNAGQPTALADGILLNASPNSTIDHCLLAGNERAGILIESSPGVKVTRTLVNGGKGLYGLVLQHTLDALDQFNAIFGATLQNRATDAGLSLPKPPEPTQALPPTEGISP